MKQIYVNQENWEAGYKSSDLMLVVRPGQINEIRDRGLFAYRLNHLQQAIFDLKRYLFLSPDNPDAAWLAQQVESMEEKFIRLN